jgi:two-component system osmolarity sensor histidine kinase EnvZ
VLAWVQLFRFYEREPRAHQVSQQIIAILNLTRAALVSSRPEARISLMREISATERIEIYPSEPGEKLEAGPVRPIAGLVESLVRAKAGADTRFAFRRNGEEGLWVSFRIDEDEYWVRMQRERLEPPPPWDWLGWGALAVLIALLGAFVLVRRVTQPLRSLAVAARAVGRGEAVPLLPEEGAREIAEVSHAFNQMTQDLKSQENNRALVLAGISHDLRTPLARLRLGVEMSSDATFRDGMVADIEQMDEVIGQFLEFARAGRDETRPGEDIDLTALAEDLHHHYTTLGHDVGVEASSRVLALGRPAALKRAVMNLIDNALRYAGTGADAHITVVVLQNETQAIIEVRDRGPGIPPDQAERLKQPFTRLDEARGSNDGQVDSAQGGSGLGLAIVDRIAHQSGGSFDLLPRDGGGLVARLTLPRVRG